MQSTAPDSIGYIELLRSNRNFRLLWSGQVASLFGDWFNLIASASLVASLTGSGLAVGALFVIRMLAPFVMSPFAGVAADRYNRKTLLILTDILRGVAVLGFLFVRDPDDVWLLFVLTAIQMAMSGLFYPTRNAILPDLVRSDELGAANAIGSTTWSVMLAVGAALGGIVSGAWGIYPAFVIDSATFFLSGIILARLAYSMAPAIQSTDRSVGAAVREYVDGLRYLRRSPDVFVIALHKAAHGILASGAFMVLQVTIAEDIYVIGEGGGISLGIMYSVFGVGTGVGPILARWITGDRDRALRITLFAAYGFIALGLAIMAPLWSFGWVLFGALLRAVGNGLNWVFSTQLLLQLAPDRVRGRVFSTEFAMFTLANAFGSAAGGWLLDATSLGVTGGLWLSSGLILLPGLGWLLWNLYGPRPQPGIDRAEAGASLPAAQQATSVAEGKPSTPTIE